MDKGESAESNPFENSSERENSSIVFEKIKFLFESNDDTSKFAGLALLKTVLDNGQVARDPERLLVLWNSIPSKFLNRLLRAQPSEKISKQEASCLTDIAISVLHFFVNLLPGTSLTVRQLSIKVPSLVKALISSSSESTKLILQILLTIVSHIEVSKKLLCIQDITPLIKLATLDASVLSIFQTTWVNVASSNDGTETVRHSIDKVMSHLVIEFKNTDAVTFLNFTSELLHKLDTSAFPPEPKWLNTLVEMIRNLSIKKPTAVGRAAYTKLAAGLISVWPASCTTLLFEDSVKKDVDSKPFSYFFINLLLIDLRTSIPTLLPELNSPNFIETVQRLSAAFDIVSTFIGFLLQNLEGPSNCKLNLTPDFLLKFRKNIAETISITIEYMRDRWDASVAGAAGLHPSTRGISSDFRPALTWESMKNDISTDPLLFAGIRTLAIWTREDENENLRRESVGLMDMWIDLYNKSTGEEGNYDFRYSIALALEGMMCTFDGIKSFLNHDGWKIMENDLNNIICLTSSQCLNINIWPSEANRGIQIIRVLLAVVDHQNTGVVEEAWMSVVKSTASIKLPTKKIIPVVTEFFIATLQLSLALLTKNADGMTKHHVTAQAPLSGLINQLKDQVSKIDNRIEAAELMELLQDASMELENLRQNQFDD